MRNFAVVGNPLAHSLSPSMHNWVFHALGLDAQYTKLEITERAVPEIMVSLRDGNLDGVNITIPFKETVIPHLDKLSRESQLIGAVNCVARENGRLTGYDTDWLGFSRSLKENGIDAESNSFVLLGAGGVARAVLFSLVSGRAKAIRVGNRHPEKAVELVSLFSKSYSKTHIEALDPEQMEPCLKENVVIINCTPVGMSPHTDDCPLPPNLIHPGHTLVDVIYTPLSTKFLKTGTMVGAKTVDGLDMFIHQGLASLDLWFLARISQRVDVTMLKQFLEDQI
ncbi:MAG: shikimate dehydrogenase [Candidatus Neomarinimicrobiota bacterium]